MILILQSKNFAISIYSYDLLGKDFAQLITGWSNGKIDCRCISSGEVLFKDVMPHGIAGIVEGDYRSVGKADLICVSVEGEGYLDLLAKKKIFLMMIILQLEVILLQKLLRTYQAAVKIKK